MRTLRWRHRAWWSRSFDLVEGDRVVGQLAMKGWGRRATFTVDGREHGLRVRGVWRWTLAMEGPGGAPLATMTLGFRGQGRALIENGRAFDWKPDGWWGTRWVLEDPQRGARVALVHMDRFLKADARVDVEEGAPDDATLLPVLALTWLGCVLSMQAAASAG